MSPHLEPHDRGPGAPDVEGRRKFHQQAGGERPDHGAPDVEGRTAAAGAAAMRSRASHTERGGAVLDTPFVVTFTFATLPIVNGACTLDAVLGGEIARGVARLEEAIGATPLACTGGVSHASSLIVLGDTGVTGTVPVVQRGRAALEGLEPGRIPKGRRRTDRFGVKNVLSHYPMRLCDGGAWLATGRIDEVRALLAGVLGIGKRRGSGAGMIEPGSLVIEPVDADPATWGLVSGPGDPQFATHRIAPVRPLPLALFRRLGGDPADAVLAIERVRQPYHDPRNAPEEAVVPWP